MQHDFKNKSAVGIGAASEADSGAGPTLKPVTLNGEHEYLLPSVNEEV